MRRRYLLLLMIGLAAGLFLSAEQSEAPYILVLGIAQDGGVPQIGKPDHPAWKDPALRKMVSSLALVDPATDQRWIFDATPDFKHQLQRLDEAAPSSRRRPGIDGIFLTHAHMGHYAGLLQIGHEGLGVSDLPLFVMPQMAAFLRDNGPWSQLVRYDNVAIRELTDGVPVTLTDRLSVTPLRVPHRQEYSEVVGFRIAGPASSVLFLPDIDSWEDWDAQGTSIEQQLAVVDVAYVDGTFFADGEIPGRDMSGFPHPFISHTLRRLDGLPATERAKVRFIHLNHSNPALLPDSEARRAVQSAGMRVAKELERLDLE